jgi:hypothetical protein
MVLILPPAVLTPHDFTQFSYGFISDYVSGQIYENMKRASYKHVITLIEISKAVSLGAALRGSPFELHCQTRFCFMKNTNAFY